MGLLDFLKQGFQQNLENYGAQALHDQYGPDWERLHKEELEKQKYAEFKRKADMAMEPFRIKERQMREESHKSQMDYYANTANDRQEEKDTMEKALQQWGDKNFGAGPDGEGPEVSLPWLKARHLADTMQKRTEELKRSEATTIDYLQDIEDERESEEAYPPREQAIDAKIAASQNKEIRQQRIDSAEEAGISKPPDLLADRDRVDDFIERELQLDVATMRDMGEEQQHEDIFAQFQADEFRKGIEDPEVLAAWDEKQGGRISLSDAWSAAAGPAKMKIIMTHLTKAVGSNYQLSPNGTDPQHDSKLVAAWMAAMQTQVNPQEWPPELFALGQQLALIADLNPQYFDQISAGTFRPGR